MAHDAAAYADSVQPWTSPAGTAAANAALVAAARIKYASTEDQVDTDYRRLTGLGGQPVLDSITPSTGVADEEDITITLAGSGFVPTSIVKMDSTAVDTTYVSGISLTAVISAAAAGDVDITVDNGAGDVSTAEVFTFTAV